MGGHDHFEGKRASGNKNQYKLFCKKGGLNISRITVKKKKKKKKSK